MGKALKTELTVTPPSSFIGLVSKLCILKAKTFGSICSNIFISFNKKREEGSVASLVSSSRSASQAEFRGLPPTHDSAWREDEVGSTPQPGNSTCPTAVSQAAVPSLLRRHFRIWCHILDSVFLMEVINCTTQLTEAGILYFRCCPGSWRSYQAAREVAGSLLFTPGQLEWPPAGSLGRTGDNSTVPAIWGDF